MKLFEIFGSVEIQGQVRIKIFDDDQEAYVVDKLWSDIKNAEETETFLNRTVTYMYAVCGNDGEPEQVFELEKNAEYFIPQIEKVYTHHNGDSYRCIALQRTQNGKPRDCVATLVREPDGYQLDAHGIQEYADHTICWDYSTGGHWPNGFLGVR